MSDNDKRRLRWQCRRGLLELDVIFEHFLEEKFDELDTAEKSSFTLLLQESDPQLLAWVMGIETVLDGKFDHLRKLIVPTK